jgi:hypothetical protein
MMPTYATRVDNVYHLNRFIKKIFFKKALNNNCVLQRKDAIITIITSFKKTPRFDNLKTIRHYWRLIQHSKDHPGCMEVHCGAMGWCHGGSS